MGIREQLGVDLAQAKVPVGTQTVSVRVVDVTDTGAVNVDWHGSLLLDVPCTDAYRRRAVGDWVAMRPGARPVVLWRLGDDPAEVDEATIREVAADAAQDLVAISAYTWGTDPPGAGWEEVTALWTRKDTGGKGVLYAQLASLPDASPDAPPTRAPKPVTITPSAYGTWRGGRPDEYASNPTQGDWTGRGNRRGGWFYGTQIEDACSGKTVASMKVKFTRKRGAGVNASRPLHLYLHDHASAPSGQLDLDDGPEELLRLSVGAKGTATLPSSWRSQLASGTARGLAIYASGPSDYLAVTGGAITITFSP